MPSIRTLTVKKAPGREPSKGLLLVEGRAYPCLLGKNGFSVFKREGDGKTPLGQFRLLYGLQRCTKLRKTASLLPMGDITPQDGWCDDPDSANYNRPVRLPFSASHEKMHRTDGLYDIVIVMDHNYSSRIKGRGSAVFFHLTADKPYTAGCIAVSRKVMQYLLPRLSTETTMRILI